MTIESKAAVEQFRIVAYTLALVAGHTRPDAEAIADDIVSRFGDYPASVENTAAIIDAVHQWVPADVFAPPPASEKGTRFGPSETEADDARQALKSLTDAADEAARIEARSAELAGTEGDPFPGDVVGDRHREFTDTGDALAAFPPGTTEADALDPGDDRYARHAAVEPDALAETGDDRATFDAAGMATRRGPVDAKHVDSVGDQDAADFPAEGLDVANPNYSQPAPVAPVDDPTGSRPAEVVMGDAYAGTMPDADAASGRVPTTGETDYADTVRDPDAGALDAALARSEAADDAAGIPGDTKPNR